MTPMFQPTLNNNSNRLDLYDLVAFHPDATFFIKYEGDDLDELGIYKNDILVVDRSVKPIMGKIAITIIEDEFKIQKFTEQNKNNLNIWGVINYIIHKA